MADCSLDAVLTDPPYGLEFMGKEWDRLLVRDRNAGFPSCRHSHGPNEYRGGIVGQQWHQEWAEAVYRVLKPGGFLLAFGATRTYHRLACAIEDAGFEIRDSILVPGVAWLYGSGFPKSTDISKQLDAKACRRELQEKLGRPPTKAEFKAAWGTWREVVGRYQYPPDHPRPPINQGGNSSSLPMGQGRKGADDTRKITAPAAPEAQRWDGYGTSLKPAWEPVCVAMKPLDGTFAENALKWGVAGLNVDGGRIGEHSWKKQQGEAGGGFKSGKFMGAMGLGKPTGVNELTSGSGGRWPANLVLVHSPDCVRRGKKKVKGSNFEGAETGRVNEVFGKDHRPRPAAGHADAGGLEEIEDWDCVPECPVRQLAEQSGERPGEHKQQRNTRVESRFFGSHKDGDVTEAYADTGTAARFFYQAKAHRKERSAGLDGKQNTHPTVKPLELCKYLATLLLPPEREMPRRILVPFAGSGSEMIGALLAGWDEVVGIERERDYVAIANARLKWWLERVRKYGAPLEPKAVLKERKPAPAPKVQAGQMEMW